MVTKTLGIGLIGVGGRGRIAHNAHQPEKGIRILGGADPYPHMIDAFKKTYGDDIFTTNDYRKLLERKEIDAVFVTSPDFLHEEHAIAALEAGKAVYLEKPIAISIEGADRILETAYRKKGKLYLGHNMRHMSFILKMKELIDSGAIGEVKTVWCRHFIAYGGDAYFKDWHAEIAKAYSLLLQKAAHDIDVMHWLCGGFTEKVNAMGALTLYDRVQDRLAPGELHVPVRERWKSQNWPPLSQTKFNSIIEVEDVSMMQMRFNNGIFACYQQCHYTPDAWRNYTFIGSEGRIENFADLSGNKIIRLWNQRTEGYNPYGDQQYFIPVQTGGHGGSDTRIINEFLSFVREDSKVSTSPVAARYAVAAGYLAAQSLREGGIPKDVPPVPRPIADYFDKDLKK
ncbi:MAG: Gfo/Idh/MocA family oxidoreductase [Candidatus Ratteibacteria bacterium]